MNLHKNPLSTSNLSNSMNWKFYIESDLDSRVHIETDLIFTIKTSKTVFLTRE